VALARIDAGTPDLVAACLLLGTCRDGRTAAALAIIMLLEFIGILLR